MHQLISAAKLDELRNALWSSACTVPSLRSLCRGVIRSQLGAEPAQKLKSLMLPSPIVAYLQFDDRETAQLFEEAVVAASCSGHNVSPAVAVGADNAEDGQAAAAWRQPEPEPSYYMGAPRTATAELRLVPRGRRARRMMDEQ